MSARPLLLGALLCGACIEPRAFPCEGSAVCVLEGEQGFCEQPVGYCSYPDDGCVSRRRFEPRAGEGLAGSCVPGGESGTGGELAACAWEEVVAGDLHVCARDSDGAVWCWGANLNGELGRMSTADVHSDARKTEPELRGVVGLSATGHTCALTDAGEVWCWGSNDRGQVSVGAPDQVLSPLRVDVPVTPDIVIVGSKRTCAAQATDARCWGDLSMGDEEFFPLELPAPMLSGATGVNHVCMIVDDADRSVYCIGDNNRGQVGIGMGQTPMNTQVVAAQDVAGPAKAIAAGRDHTCVIVEPPGADGDRIQCWGENNNQQAGSIGGGVVWTATDVSGNLPAVRWRDIAAGPEHTCAISEAGEIYCWGDNRFGRADPSPSPPWDQVARPIELDEFEPFEAVDITAGITASCAIGTDGRWLCWGCLSPWTIDPDVDGDQGCAGTIREISC